VTLYFEKVFTLFVSIDFFYLSQHKRQSTKQPEFFLCTSIIIYFQSSFTLNMDQKLIYPTSSSHNTGWTDLQQESETAFVHKISSQLINRMIQRRDSVSSNGTFNQLIATCSSDVQTCSSKYYSKTYLFMFIFCFALLLGLVAFVQTNTNGILMNGMNGLLCIYTPSAMDVMF
jgi:hypothetical protein